MMKLQSIPDQLKDKSASEVALSFIKPPVGALVAAMISTFGIYLFASFLYVGRIYSSWVH